MTHTRKLPYPSVRCAQKQQAALEAVLADAESQQVTDYWFLGDLLARTGRRNILDRMEQLPIPASGQGIKEAEYSGMPCKS